jgi:hypothetical protein
MPDAAAKSCLEGVRSLETVATVKELLEPLRF